VTENEANEIEWAETAKLAADKAPASACDAVLSVCRYLQTVLHGNIVGHMSFLVPAIAYVLGTLSAAHAPERLSESVTRVGSRSRPIAAVRASVPATL
jgi:hypothetical protein